MEGKIQLALLIISLMERAMEEISQKPELRDSILDGAQNIDDWLQEKLGKVSRPSTAKSVTLAIDTSVVRDQDTICSIIAVITTLYATRKVTRGAHVGGTLRKHFGEDVFPHIDERELRFAKPVNEKVYNHVLESVSESFLDIMKEYDFKKYSDFSNVDSGYRTWAATSYIGTHGLAKALLDYGPNILSILKTFLNFKST
ncbi:hypothetical protein [Shewanella sp. KCT]|uniref:hypothetical protein n=1 Tax=Shewanella sp. KCT TaxID=2569535 RepID=UPI001183937D|nr:hypothetical protein [Shewanella sp. KCT]TVP12695.1 hypothetical protein AYI87_13445 [Shewanella sp. KCT]